MESTEFFAFSATLDRIPPLLTAPLTHPSKPLPPSTGDAGSGNGTAATSIPLLEGITGLEYKWQNLLICIS